MNPIRNTVCLIAVLLLVEGCDLTGSGDVVISSVQSGLNIDLINPLDTESRFAIKLSTTEAHCDDAELVVLSSLTKTELDIQVVELQESVPCAGGKSVLVSKVDFDPQNASYDLSIDIGSNLRNRGVLSYNGEVYSLEFEDLNGIELGVSQLRRIPENIVFGFVSNPGNSSVLLSELTEAAKPYAGPSLLQLGNYGHFMMGTSSEVTLNSDPEVAYNYAYVLKLKSSVSEFDTFLEEFRATLPDDVVVSCTTWNGQKL